MCIKKASGLCLKPSAGGPELVKLGLRGFQAQLGFLKLSPHLFQAVSLRFEKAGVDPPASTPARNLSAVAL